MQFHFEAFVLEINEHMSKEFTCKNVFMNQCLNVQPKGLDIHLVYLYNVIVFGFCCQNNIDLFLIDIEKWS